MPKIVKPLTDIQVKNAKQKDKSYTLSDGDGLFLEVTKLGSKLWRMKYTSPSSGKSTWMSFGSPFKSPQLYSLTKLVAVTVAREERERSSAMCSRVNGLSIAINSYIDIRSYLFLPDRFYGLKSRVIAQINVEMAT